MHRGIKREVSTGNCMFSHTSIRQPCCLCIIIQGVSSFHKLKAVPWKSELSNDDLFELSHLQCMC
jgi:hypothetical protein